MNEKKKWPSGFIDSFVIGFILIVFGFLCQIFFNNIDLTLLWPNNLIAGIVFTNILIFIYFFFKNRYFVVWLSSAPTAISSIVYISFLALLGGFISQGDGTTNSIILKLGLNNVFSSWPFIITMIFFLTTLGMTTLKRTFPFKKENFGFILNHLGLWLIVFSAGLGTGDIQQLSMKLTENNIVWHAQDDKQKVYELPVAFKLLQFDIDEYNPKLAIIDNTTGDMQGKEGNNLLAIEDSLNTDFQGYNITIDEFYKYSFKNGENFHPVNHMDAAPAAKITVTDNGNTVNSWVTCGSFMIKGEALKINDKFSLVMLPAEAKKYSSKIQVYTKEGRNDTATIEVNKPITVDNWKVYQLSYNSDLGKWSDYSIIQLVRDPWLPAVYVGIYMLILGSFYMIWQGRKKNIIKNDLD
jgi:hypothetical protein